VPLVERRTRIYAQTVHGPRRKKRRVVGWLLIAFLVLAPWIRIGGLPAVRMDIPGRRLLLLGQIFTPHDTWVLAFLGLAAALGLFLFTAVLGRVWCGWACPQTVWLEWVFRPIEFFFEGSAHKARRRDKGPHNLKWLARKAGKLATFALVSLLVTGVFMAWFVGGPELLRGEIGSAGMGVYAFMGGLFFADFAWFREQMCHYACPYARIQGVLMAETSLVVAYDEHRGEPRKEGKRIPGVGDCIDCGLCAAVCPSGIDIRLGDQLQCIACGACADACDSVMVKIGKPERLVRYTTAPEAPATPDGWKPRMGPRAAIYLMLLLAVLVGLGVGVATRSEVMVAVARVPTTELYQQLPEGRIANRLTIHITNRGTDGHRFRVEPLTPGAELAVPGLPSDIPFGGESRWSGFVTAPAERFTAGRLPVQFQVVRDDGVVTPAELTMLGPGT